MLNRRTLGFGLAAMACAGSWPTVWAQDYPRKTIKMIIPATTGSSDVIARALAPRLAAALGQSVVIEQMPGAGTNIGNNLNQVTVETETLRTGFELTLFGLERDGVIFTDINLSSSELLRFTAFTALGTELQLPQTSSRDVKTNVAARPGDVILMSVIRKGQGSLVRIAVAERPASS